MVPLFIVKKISEEKFQTHQERERERERERESERESERERVCNLRGDILAWGGGGSRDRQAPRHSPSHLTTKQEG